jgi:hypothetical protein
MNFSEYLTSLDESDDVEFGETKVDLPEEEGFSAAKSALDDFVEATDDNDDDEDIDLSLDDMCNEGYYEEDCTDDLDEDTVNNIREACEYILTHLDALTESDESEIEKDIDIDDLDLEDDDDGEIAINGEDDDDYIENGVDLHTIVPHNSEDEQFSEIEVNEGDTELEESFTGWDDLL